MADRAVSRSLDSYLRSQNPTLRAQGEFLQTGDAPDGFRVMDNGMVHREGDFNNFMDRHGWQLMAALVGGGTLGGMATGAPLIGTGGSAAASGGVLPSTSYAGAVPQVGSAAATGGNLGATAASAGAGSGGVMGQLRQMFGGLGMRDAVGLAPLAMGLFGGGSGGDGEVPMGDELEQILGLQRQRMEMTEPLYRAMLQMAMSLLPTYARGGR